MNITAIIILVLVVAMIVGPVAMVAPLSGAEEAQPAARPRP